MIVVALLVIGLVLGSFVNALIWRVHEQAKSKKNAHDERLSILRGRSMCPNCQHYLTFIDLIPVFSWLWQRGRCRYCGKPISKQYPLVELATAGLFVASYIWWPEALHNPLDVASWHSIGQNVMFGLWLLLITGFTALLIYDFRWMMLPNRIVYPMTVLAGVYAAFNIAIDSDPFGAIINTFLAVLIGGGIFYLLFQISKGKWIGGGDVKLGWIIGLVVGTPVQSMLVIFIASLLGSLVSIPLLYSKRLKKSALIPFGPFLIVATIVVVLFGSDVVSWYEGLILGPY